MMKQSGSTRFKPFVTVAVVVQSRDQYLLVEEIPAGGQAVTFNQPAGHLESSETIIGAAERELLEETGLAIELTQLIGIYQLTVNGKEFIRFTFKTTLEEPVEITPQDPQIIADHWFTLDQIKKLNNLRSHLVIECIEDDIKNGSFAAKLVLKSL